MTGSVGSRLLFGAVHEEHEGIRDANSLYVQYNYDEGVQGQATFLVDRTAAAK